MPKSPEGQNPIEQQEKKQEKDLTNFLEKIEEIKWFSPSKEYLDDDLKPIIADLREILSIESNLDIDLISGDAESCFSRVIKPALDQEKNWPGASNYGGEFGEQLGLAEDSVWEAVESQIGEKKTSQMWTKIFYQALDTLSNKSPNTMALWMAPYFITNSGLYIAGSKSGIYKKKYPQNPFGKILEIYDLGLCPVGTDNEVPNQFIVWHPPISQQ